MALFYFETDGSNGSLSTGLHGSASTGVHGSMGTSVHGSVGTGVRGGNASGDEEFLYVDDHSATDGTTEFSFGCEPHCPEEMSLHIKVFIIVAYSAITIIALSGNVTVCYIVYAYQRMRTVTNYFIVNLAFSDILMAVMCIPFTFVANLLIGYWPFGAFMCPLVMYLQVVSVFLSAFTLVAISLDRFVAILLPLRPKLTTRQAIPLIVLIWLLSLLVPLPVAIVSRVVSKPDVLSGELKPFCEEQWWDAGMRSVYSTLIMVLQYFLPLLVLAITYTWIGYIIWGRKAPGEPQSSRDQRRAASKRKVNVTRAFLALTSV